MISEKELQEGMAMCQIGEPTPEKMIRLAAYMTVHDHLFGKPSPVSPRKTHPDEDQRNAHTEQIDTRGTSDFLISVSGKDAGNVMSVIDELMATVQALHPKMYDSVLRKIANL